MEPIGLYIHVPFCDGKCAYCDFYSLSATEMTMEQYTEAIIKRIEQDNSGKQANTLYFGGGTPNLLGAERICRIIAAAKQKFELENAEITVEVNPTHHMHSFYDRLRAGGVNRLSIGLQSANEKELKLLGRRHTVEQAAEAVALAKKAGFENISLDLMLAIPDQTRESLHQSFQFCAQAGVQHISAYLLKIEEGTRFYEQQERLQLPNEDETAERYLMTCKELEKSGFLQYEISNFAKSGFESRHNLKYWNCEEYLGIGPAAHSFLNGERFYYPRDLRLFLEGGKPILDSSGGDAEEYAMLALRVKKGLTKDAFQNKFEKTLPEEWIERAKRFEKAGLVVCGKDGFFFTPKGFLVSNRLIAEILFG